MKSIEPVTIWKNGESFEANLLNAYIINDNLATACTFYYQLCISGQPTEDEPLIIGQTLADGNVTMSGEDYLNWDDSNNAAYAYIADKLNLTIL
jgi:hypothetical protein